VEFALSEEQRQFQQVLRDFFVKEAPTELVREADRTETFPDAVWRKMVDLGLMSLGVPEEYGGTPTDEITLCIVNEEMARASGALAYAWIPTVQFGAKALTLYGTAEQKQDYLPRIVTGDLRMSMGLSEPDAGSDLAHLRTSAALRGDRWVVNGQKVFTTGADRSDYIITLVRVPGDDRGGLTILLVPASAPGVSIRPLGKLSGQATHTCETFFENVEVPEQNVLGTVGGGVKLIFSLLDAERIYNGANGVGIAQGAFDLARDYAAGRVQFGQPIIDFQAIGHALVDMHLRVEQARMMVYRSAWKMQQGLPCSMDASLAKIAGSEAGTQNAAAGMQILGGYSYMTDYPMERYYRESKLYEIVAGTNQIQRNIVLKHIKSQATS
jgi:alkylation response protein AidB-like acyl-CoA dehydrogenase